VVRCSRRARQTHNTKKKLFGDFLDKSDGAAEEIAAELGADLETLSRVRLASHGLRFLGVLARGERDDHLVLVDLDTGPP